MRCNPCIRTDCAMVSEAEVERLRNQVTHMVPRTDWEFQRRLAVTLEAEVERLRGDLDTLNETFAMTTREVGKQMRTLTCERDKLREALSDIEQTCKVGAHEGYDDFNGRAVRETWSIVRRALEDA